jgi:thiol-disulfide isomerase/thioredoxin
LIVLVAVLAAAAAAGLVLRRRQGKFKRSTVMLTAGDLGSALGERATLVQFSTEFCANCPPTRRLLGQVAAEHEGVTLVEVDAAARLDLARRLNVLATPTILVLGPDGAVASRASGQPRKADVLAAVGSVLRPSAARARAGQ